MNMRPPPPQGAPPSYAFVTKYYKRSLRPVVIAISLMTAIWSLFAGIGFFRNVSVYNNNGARTLGLICIIVGSLYMGVVAIGLYGIFAAATQKLALIRIHAYLSALAALTVAGISLLKIIIHFTMKDDIIKTCSNSSTGPNYAYAGWWGPVYSGTLSGPAAVAFCNRHYDRESWSEIVGFIILTTIAIFFCIIVFNYLRQTLDPSNPGNVTRDPQRVFNFTPQYQPPYGPPPDSGFRPDYYNYPGPAVPPPHDNAQEMPVYDKPPGYIRDGFEGYDKGDDKVKDIGPQDGSGSRGERDLTSPNTAYR